MMADADESAAGSDCDVPAVQQVMDVDRYIWQYMSYKSAQYRARIDGILRACGDSSITESDVELGMVRLSVTPGDGEPPTMTSSCCEQLLQLVNECRGPTGGVSTLTLDGHDQDACGALDDNSSMLEDADAALVDVDSASGVIRLTGTKDEINHALGLLEVLGVPLPGHLPAVAAPPPWNDDDDDDTLYASRRTGDARRHRGRRGRRDRLRAPAAC